jgi:hypothetical protein
MLKVRRRPDLGQEPLRSHDSREFGLQYLQGDPPLVAQVIRQVDRRHPTLTELAVDSVAAFESCVQTGDEVGHGGNITRGF